MKKIGFIVVEGCEDYEQVLALNTANTLPPGGLLEWPDRRMHSCVFPTRRAARDAINRTHYYAKAFGKTDLPDKAFCTIRPVASPSPVNQSEA